MWGLFWNLNSIPWVCVSTLPPVLTIWILWLCSKFWKWWLWAFLQCYSFNTLLASLVASPPHIYDQLAILSQSQMEFDRVCTESTDQLGEYCHLNNIKASLPWTWSLSICFDVLLLSVFCSFLCISIVLSLLSWFLHIWFIFIILSVLITINLLLCLMYKLNFILVNIF